MATITTFGICSICASAFTFDDISTLKCGHTFHGECINKWIQKAANCPKCRSENSLTDIMKLYVDDGPTNIPDVPQMELGQSGLYQTGPNGIQPQDPEKRKLIQQQLVLLLHAHKCQKRECQHCTLPYCNVMKSVLEHMVNCNNLRQCQYPHCASSRQIITHWKNCVKEDCPICNPVKKYVNQQGAGSSVEAVACQDSQQQMGQQATGQPSPGPGSSNSCVGRNMFGSPLQGANVISLLDGYFPDPNICHGGDQQMMGQQPTGFVTNNEGMPPPLAPCQPRDWHASITPDLRNHLVAKLVKAIFPSPDLAAIHDERLKDLQTYARKVENDMFELAPDKEAYYNMLAKRIYKIQKELQEKKNRRMNELQQQQQQQQHPAEQQMVQQFDGSGLNFFAGMHMFGLPQQGANDMNTLFNGYTPNPNGDPQMMGQQPTGFGPNNEGFPPPLAPMESQIRPNDISLIMNKIREAKTAEEREAMFADLKKTPHLFNAFLKMTKRPNFMPQVKTGHGPYNAGIPPPLPPSESRKFNASMMPDLRTNSVRPNDISLIMNKIREAKTAEEREAMFADLKKTPHLFNAFLKMTKTPDFMPEASALQRSLQQFGHQQ